MASAPRGRGWATDDDFYRRLLEQAPSLVFCVDFEGRLRYANSTLRDCVGRSKSETLANVSTFLHGDSLARLEEAIVRLRDDHRPVPVEVNVSYAADAEMRCSGLASIYVGDGEAKGVQVFLTPHPNASDVERPSNGGVAEEQDAAKILVCEDNALCAALLKNILGGEGYSVDVASTAQRARELLAEREYMAMTLDVVLPDESGLDLLDDIRNTPHTAELPVLIVSGGRPHDDFDAGDRQTVVDWLEKPVESDSLREAVERVTATSSSARPRVLHVEDDPSFRATIDMLLSEYSETLEASTVSMARKILRREPDIDLVLLDLTLPDGLGAELLPFLNRPNGEAIPVVVISAEEVSDVIADNVDETLVKSRVSHNELISTIRRHLEPN